MKTLLLLLTLFGSQAIYAETIETIEIGVNGLSCSFCVDKLDRNLEALPSINNAEVSLKNKTARIVMKAGAKADISAIRAAIVDAGFTSNDVIKQ